MKRRSSGFRTEYNRLQGRIDAMYVDKLDGRIDAAFFDRMAAQWRDEQARCLREIERHQTANQSYLDEGIQLSNSRRYARRLFERQEPREKRRLAQFRGFELLLEGRGADRRPYANPLIFLRKPTTASAVADGRYGRDPGQI